MSWIFGYTGKFSETIQKPDVDKQSNVSVQTDQLMIRAGGIPSTCIHHVVDQGERGWIVCGLGIDTRKNMKIFGKDEWGDLLSPEEIRLNDIDGHYIILRWDRKNLQIFTDRLGLRDIYLSEINQNIVFSTRLDWISKTGNHQVNFKEFGSRWLLYHQLSSGSLLENIKRINSSTSVHINRDTNTCKIKQNSWLPDQTNIQLPVNEWSQKLNDIIRIPIKQGYQVSCSLSGGMDSRVILSYLLKQDKAQWDTHTFGPPGSPDVIVAKEISEKYQFANKNYYRTVPAAEKCIELLYDYVKFSHVSNPATSTLQLQYYHDVAKDSQIIIDGGFGEIWRREFFNRLLLLGKKALMNKDIDVILNHLTIQRADIFSEPVKQTMMVGCKEQILKMVDELPQISEVGVENWLDLLALKTRLQNFYSPEQVRIDHLIPSFMPFIQTSVLEHLFHVKNRVKRNAGLFKKILNANEKSLTKIRLAKGNTTHPFCLTSFQTRAWVLWKKKLGKIYQQNDQSIFLNQLSEFVQDTVHSKSVQEYPYYNYHRIKRIISDYYHGETHLADQVDWWLAFETFRQVLNGKT